MFCYRDMTFCSDSKECANDLCSRMWTEREQERANKWWGKEGAPVAFSPFKETCGKFTEAKV